MIDAVLTWVDASDPAWSEKKRDWERQYGIGGDAEESDSRDVRYRDFETLRYWFRSIEKNAPWIRYIHLVTDRQIPSFLRTEHPKLRLVNHEDIIPQEFLPTFNSCAIELFLHRIPELTDTFIYFNDDFFVNRAVREEDFFVDGKPVDMLSFQPVVANPKNPVMSHLLLNEALILSKYFDKRTVAKTQRGKLFRIGYPPMYFCYNLLELAFPKFTGFYNVHCHMNLLKQTYETLWELEREAFTRTASHKFRSREDAVIYLFKDYEKLSGNFHPVNQQRIFRYYEVTDDNAKLAREIEGHRHPFLCINDSNDEVDFARAKETLRAAFERAYPEKSSFEKD